MSLADYAANLSNKRRATEEDLAMYRQLEGGRGAIVKGDSVFILDTEEENDQLDALEHEASAQDNPFWDFDNNVPEGVTVLPDSIDYRHFQTPIKNQGFRGTCVCFASLANLEAILKRSTNTDFDLSEQYANWLYMGLQNRNQCDDGLRTTLAARYLSQYGVCTESYAPYESKSQVQQHCNASPSDKAKSDARYGIDSYTLIDRIGFNGPSIANSDYLEKLLYEKYDITFGTHVAWGLPDPNGVHDVILDRFGNPLKSRGGHAMLIVGYDRSPNAPIPYFICKNSWGTARGVNGYYYLSYDYIRTYAKYGYIVTKMNSNKAGTPS